MEAWKRTSSFPVCANPWPVVPIGLDLGMGKSSCLPSSGLVRKDPLRSSCLRDAAIFNKDDMQMRLGPYAFITRWRPYMFHRETSSSSMHSWLHAFHSEKWALLFFHHWWEWSQHKYTVVLAQTPANEVTRTPWVRGMLYTTVLDSIFCMSYSIAWQSRYLLSSWIASFQWPLLLCLYITREQGQQEQLSYQNAQRKGKSIICPCHREL